MTHLYFVHKNSSETQNDVLMIMVILEQENIIISSSRSIKQMLQKMLQIEKSRKYIFSVHKCQQKRYDAQW